MKQFYLNIICNSKDILDCIEYRIEEINKINDDSLKDIILDVCFERLYLLEKFFIENKKEMEIENVNKSKELNLSVGYQIINDVFLLAILETIGKTGLSRIADLKNTYKFKKTFASSNGEFNQSVLSKKIKELQEIEIIDLEQINTGRKGGYEYIYTLSELGKELYVSIFSTEPVKNDKYIIKENYPSLEQGYFVRTVALEFQNKGYDVLFTKQTLNSKDTVVISEMNIDLIDYTDLILFKDNDTYYINCELGTSSEESLSEKIEKLMNYTNTVSFIMNNQESLNKTSQKVDKYITTKGRNNLIGYTFRFTTIDTLKKKEVWQNKGPF